MDNKKSKVICILLLNMLDAEISRLIENELNEDNENSNHELVTSLIAVLDNIDVAIDCLYKAVV